MNVSEIMTAEPTCCAPDTILQEVAAMMVVEDCGEIPVCEDGTTKPIGVVTDRDIVCRTIARNLNPLTMIASDCMSEPCVTVTPDMSLEECSWIMEKHQVRRLPVIDENGVLCGIVSQADIASHSHEAHTGRMVKTISQRAEPSSRRDASGGRKAA